jgi:hypothetical protein
MKTMMAVLFFCVAASAPVLAAPFDDFSQGRIDPTKWRNLETGRYVENGQVILFQQAEGSEFSSSNLEFTNPDTITSIGARVNLKEVDINNPSEFDYGLVAVGGEFYEDGTGSRVMAFVQIQFSPFQQGDAIVNCFADGGEFISFPTTVSLDQEVIIAIRETGANTFRCVLDADLDGNFEEAVDIAGPAFAADITDTWKVINAGIGSDGRPVSGYVEATVDDVEIGINGGSLADYDDFAASRINPAKWLQGTWDSADGSNFLGARGIDDADGNGKLAMFLQFDGTAGMDWNQIGARIQDDQITGTYFQADVTLDPATTLTGTDPDANQAQVRLDGLWYNDTYDGSQSNPYIGDEGLVTPQLRVRERGDQGVSARAHIFRCDDADCNTITDVFGQTLGCTVTKGQPNTLSMERSGTEIIFRCDDSEVRHTITTNLYPHEFDMRRLRLRAIAEDGEQTDVFAYFDNIYLRKPSDFSWSLFLPAIIGRQSEPGWGAENRVCCPSSAATFSLSTEGDTASSTIATCSSQPTWEGWVDSSAGAKTFNYVLKSATCGTISGNFTYTLEKGKTIFSQLDGPDRLWQSMSISSPPVPLPPANP